MPARDVAASGGVPQPALTFCEPGRRTSLSLRLLPGYATRAARGGRGRFLESATCRFDALSASPRAPRHLSATADRPAPPPAKSTCSTPRCRASATTWSTAASACSSTTWTTGTGWCGGFRPSRSRAGVAAGERQGHRRQRADRPALRQHDPPGRRDRPRHRRRWSGTRPTKAAPTGSRCRPTARSSTCPHSRGRTGTSSTR